MTIKELIKKLQQYPNQMKVIVRTNDNGLEDIFEVSEVISDNQGTVVIDSYINPNKS